MVGLQLLYQVDSRLRQLQPHDVPFGGFHISLIGNFAQLPPVIDTALYSKPSGNVSEYGQMARDGSVLYALFTANY